MGPLQVSLLWALLFVAGGDSQNVRDIVTQSGSELLLPVTQRLTLHPPNCDRYEWKYVGIREDEIIARSNSKCELTPPDSVRFPNMKISENGSLIISPVTAENAATYFVELTNAAGRNIPTNIYRLYVEGDSQNIREIEIVTQPGSELLLPVTQRLTFHPPYCDRYDWRYEAIKGEGFIAYNWRCGLTPPDSVRYPNMKISENGSLIISPVTAENAGPYTVWLTSAAGRNIGTYTYKLDVEAPVSPPVLDIVCLRDGRAQVSCRVDDGSHYTIYLNVTGPSEGGYSSPSNNITVTVPTSDPWSVTCTAENRVSRRNVTQTRAACPAPVSVPVITVSCLWNGSAEISCEVQNGTDLTLTLTINGSSEVYNTTSLQRRVSVTVPSMLSPSNVTCSARNSISNSSTMKTADDCLVLSSSLYAKLLPVRLFLVIILPVFLACFEVYHHLQEKRSG